jgi:hypothetical protein
LNGELVNNNARKPWTARRRIATSLAFAVLAIGTSACDQVLAAEEVRAMIPRTIALLGDIPAAPAESGLTANDLPRL